MIFAEPSQPSSDEIVMQEIDEVKGEPTIEEGENIFENFFFYVKCPCELKQDLNPGIQISYTFKCFDTVNNVFYRVAIESHKDILDSLGMPEIDSAFSHEFLNEYKSSLVSNQTEYGDAHIYGFNGVQYQQKISVDGTSMYSNSLIFLAHCYSYTFSVLTNIKDETNYFYSFINSITFLNANLNSTPDSKLTTESYISPKYGYSINIPLRFSFEEPIGRNIDLRLANENGCSFTVNVSERLNEEYSINAHDYSQQFMESIMRPSHPNFKIHQSEKVIIDGEKAFMYTYSNNDGLTAIGCYIFHGDKVYLLTGTSPTKYFDSNRDTFSNSIKSLIF